MIAVGRQHVRLPLNQDCWLGTRGAPVSDQYEERTVDGYRSEVQSSSPRSTTRGLVIHPRPAQPQADRAAGSATWRCRTPGHRVPGSPSPRYAGNPRSCSTRSTSPTPATTRAARLPVRPHGVLARRGCQAPAEDDTPPRWAGSPYGAGHGVGRDRDPGGAGAEQPVLLGGLDYANDLSHWLEFAPDDDQLVAAVHPTTSRRAPTRRAGTTCSARWPTASVVTSAAGRPAPQEQVRRELPRPGPTSTASGCCSGCGPTTRRTRWHWSPTSAGHPTADGLVAPRAHRPARTAEPVRGAPAAPEIHSRSTARHRLGNGASTGGPDRAGMLPETHYRDVA